MFTCKPHHCSLLPSPPNTSFAENREREKEKKKAMMLVTEFVSSTFSFCFIYYFYGGRKQNGS
ncbi:hypothetical protein I3760_06G085500 [Carya illinoinensis]|nr:hypothetical protein I3760_06G085500 [Carya illinoinensis]